jgi:hypothetical protein
VPITEEIFQTLLANKNQGNLGSIHAPNIIKPTQTRITRMKYTFFVIKSLEHLKKLKTGCILKFWPRTDHACPQKPNPSRETVPSID